MDINLTLSPATSITQKIAVRIYKATAPSVVVGMQQFDAPHNAAQNVSFTDLDPGVYIVNTYETPGDPTLGTLRHSFIYDPTFQMAVIKPSEFLKMTAGTTSYTDALWAEYDIDIVYRASFGPLFVSDQIDWILDTGKVIGFQLSQIGDSFADQEQITVTFKPKIVTVSPTVVSSKTITGESIITTDVTIDDSYAGKLIRLQGSGSSFTVSLPAIGSTEQFLQYTFVSDGGSHVIATIDIDGAGSINHFGNRTELHLAQGEKAIILYTGADYVVLSDTPGALHVGEIVDQYDKDMTVQATVFADGSLLDRNVYRRLWEYVQQLDSSMVVSDAVWTATPSPITNPVTTNGKYSLGDGVTTFRVPRLYTAGYAKAVDGTTRLAASHEVGTVKTHYHETTIGLLPVSLFFRGIVSRLTGQYNGTRTGVTDTTGAPIDANGVAVDGSKNLTDNFGVYKLIRF